MVVPPLFNVFTALATWKPSTSSPKTTLLDSIKFDSVTPNFGSMMGKLQATKSIMVWSHLKNNTPSTGYMACLASITFYLPRLIHEKCTPSRPFLAELQLWSSQYFLEALRVCYTSRKQEKKEESSPNNKKKERKESPIIRFWKPTFKPINGFTTTCLFRL